MKVYFTASLRGKKDFGDYYSRIVRSLESLGYSVFSDHILKMDFGAVEKQDKEQVKKIYRKLISEIKKADVFVAEASTQSMSVGHEITQAMNLNKPVVVLYTGDRRPSLLFGSGYEKLLIVSYDQLNVKDVLSKAVDEAKKYTDVRFNFFVSPKILAYLDWVAQKRMVPRSVFLRDLIEKEMKKDKEFKG
jgi:hypothetical protein